MKVHHYKVYDLKPCEMKHLKDILRYFVKHGVKITFLTKVMYVHLKDDQLYSAIANVLHGYKSRLIAKQEDLEWLFL